MASAEEVLARAAARRPGPTTTVAARPSSSGQSAAEILGQPTSTTVAPAQQQAAVEQFKESTKRRDGGGRSLFEQARGLVSNLPAGLWGLAVVGAKEAGSLPIDAAKGLVQGPRDGGKPIWEGEGTLGDRAGRNWAQVREDRPLITAMGESWANTWADLGRTVQSAAPGGQAFGDNPYSVAVREGRILDKLVEDVGNVALTGGLASRFAVGGALRAEAAASRAGTVQAAERAARLRARAEGVRRATGVANAMADSPALPFRAAARGAKWVAPRAGELATRTAAGAAAADRLTAAADARRLKRDFRQEVVLPAKADEQVLARQNQLRTRAGERVLRDRDAQAATILVHGQGFQQQLAIIDQLPPEARPRALGRVFPEIEQSASPRTVEIVRAYADGTIDPDLKAAMDTSWPEIRKMMAQNEEFQLAGRGSVDPMDPAQLGDDPIQSQIDRRLAPLEERIDRLDRDLVGDPKRGRVGALGQVARAEDRVVRNTPDPEAIFPQRTSVAAVDLGRQVERAETSATDSAAATAAAGRLADRADAMPGPTAERMAGVEQGAVRLSHAERRAQGRATVADRARERIRAEAETAERALVEQEDQARRLAQFEQDRPAVATPESITAERRAQWRDAQEQAKRAEEAETRRLFDEFDTLRNVPGPGEPLYAEFQAWAAQHGLAGKGGRLRNIFKEADPTRREQYVRGGKVHERQGPRERFFLQGKQRIPGMGMLHEGGLDFDWQEGLDRLGSVVDRINELREFRRTRPTADDFASGAAGRLLPVEFRAEGLDLPADEAARLRNMPHEPPMPRAGIRPAWTYPLDEFVAHVEALDAVLDDIASDGEFLDPTPAQDAAHRELANLLPPGWDDADLAVAHARLVEAAQAHGLEGAPPVEAPLDPTERVGAAGRRAVEDAEARALAAYETDLATVADMADIGQAMDSSFLEFGDLDWRAQRIYRQLEAEARTGQAGARLAASREATAGRIFSAGERRGAATGGARREARRGAELDRRSAKAADRLVELTRRVDTAGTRDAERARRAGTREGRAVEAAAVQHRKVRQMLKTRDRLTEKAAKERARLEEGPILPAGSKMGQVVPGRYQPALRANQRLQAEILKMAGEADDAAPGSGEWLRGLADQAATTMRKLQAAGVEPEYVIGGVDALPQGATRIPGRGRDRIPWRNTKGVRTGKTMGRLPLSYRAAGRLATERFTRIVENEAADTTAQRYAKTADDVVSRMAIEQGWDVDGPELAELKARLEHGGQDVAKWMEREGWLAWDPNAPTGDVPEKMVRRDTLFLPRELKREFAAWFRPAKKNGALGAYDWVTRGWKHAVLALNPMWNVGNMVSNAIMLEIGTGASPGELRRAFAEVREMMKLERETGELHFPPRLYDAGMSGETLRFFADRPDEARGIMGRHPIQASYEFNNRVDNFGRQMAYVINRGRGMSDEAAVRQALKVMGDFNNMRPIERDFVRRIMPFYAWSKHVTLLSSHLAITHPARVAWTLALADKFGPEAEDGTPSWLEGAIPLGGNRWLTMGSLNPFGRSVDSPFVNPTEFLRGTNPVLQAGVLGLTGINLQRGRLATRPRGTGPTDEYGNPELGPIGWGPMAYNLMGRTPLTRAAYSMVADPYVRYDTGEPMTRSRRPIRLDEADNWLFRAARDLGIPGVPVVADPKEIAARVRRREREADRARRAG
ncbi:MAG: hypothetical protein AB7G37_03420 [Solirubrobacteraceae bacterium]